MSDVEILALWGPRSDGPANNEILSFARAVEAATCYSERTVG